MEELFALLFAAIAELIVEAFGELLFCTLLKTLYRVFVAVVGKQVVSTLGTICMMLVTGVFFGFISVWLIPHPIVRPSRVHGISVVLSPLLVGFASSQMDRLYSDTENRESAVQSFRNGALFAFAMAMVRYWFVQ